MYFYIFKIDLCEREREGKRQREREWKYRAKAKNWTHLVTVYLPLNYHSKLCLNVRTDGNV